MAPPLIRRWRGARSPWGKASSRLFSRSPHLRTRTEALADSSFYGGVGPDREPGDLVAGFLDSVLYLMLLVPPSLERNCHHVPCRVYLGFVDLCHPCALA
jgi:hypothetical protein